MGWIFFSRLPYYFYKVFFNSFFFQIRLIKLVQFFLLMDFDVWHDPFERAIACFFFPIALSFHFVDTHLLSVDGTHHHIQNPCIPSQQSCPLNCEYYVKGGTGCEFCMCDNSHQSKSPSLFFVLAISWQKTT